MFLYEFCVGGYEEGLSQIMTHTSSFTEEEVQRIFNEACAKAYWRVKKSKLEKAFKEHEEAVNAPDSENIDYPFYEIQFWNQVHLIENFGAVLKTLREEYGFLILETKESVGLWGGEDLRNPREPHGGRGINDNQIHIKNLIENSKPEWLEEYESLEKKCIEETEKFTKN